MSLSRCSARRVAVWSAAAVLGGLAFASNAWALAPPTGLSLIPGSPTNATSVEVTFDPVALEPDATTMTYEAGLDGNFAPADPAGTTVPTPNVGIHTLQVRAVQDGTPGDVAETQLVIDRQNPTVAVTLTGTLRNGWYRQLTLNVACDDNVQIGGPQCADVPWTTTGEFPSGYTANVTDAAGNPGTGTSPAFKFDNAVPTRPGLVGPGDLVSAQPTFSWIPSADANSGVEEYRIQWQPDEDFDPNGWQTLATVPDDGRVGDYTAPPSVWSGAPLPENVPLLWRVVAADNAGNVRTSNPSTKSLTIDPTVPPAPIITGGPNAPTQNTSPTFTWEGGGASFQWSVTSIQAPNTSVRSGAGTAKEATAQSLPDGAYVFHVKQFTAANRESEEAIRSFVVDTTPPAAPTILTRPTFPSVTDAVFTWATEPGAYSRWSVLDSSGGVVSAPSDTPVTSATLPQLADGTYSFQLQQIDAAGNVSPATVEPFTVIAPLVPPSGGNGTITILPKQNANRLQPKAGKILTSRTPVLRWSRGPRGTKLFNLQVFRVTTAKGSRTPKVTKILSAFPKGRAYRVPRGKTAPKACYVWRVWPYTGREFTPKPLGVSNYCIASKRVLAKKARIIAQRKAAKARSRSNR